MLKELEVSETEHLSLAKTERMDSEVSLFIRSFNFPQSQLFHCEPLATCLHYRFGWSNTAQFRHLQNSVTHCFSSSDASKYLLELLEPLEEDRRTMWINNILTWLQEQRLESALVNQQTLAKCIQEWSHRGEEDSHSREVTVVDAFQLSPLSYRRVAC